jgi:hypothetical protein
VHAGTMSALAAWAALLALPACDHEPTPQLFRLTLCAQDTQDRPVPGTRFWADGRELGVTAADGVLRVALDAHAAHAVILSAACPAAYRTREPRRRIAPQQRGSVSARIALELTTACEPLDHAAVVIVRARAAAALAGMPIRSDGEVIGQTDLDGTAHVMLHARAGTSLHIALDTRAWPELAPRDPVQTFQLGDEDAILLVDQRFTTPEPVAPTPRRIARKLARHTPYRID